MHTRGTGCWPGIIIWAGPGWSATLRYVAVVDGEPVALVGFARAALKGGVRDAAMGWTPDQRAARLRYVVNNARFVILPRFQIANLGSHGRGRTCAG